MPFAELYCRSADGSNLNAGSTNVAAASLTYASGSWVQSTRVFTVASGNPVTDGVAVGNLVSVYADGSSVTGYTGYVTAVTATTITVHATRSSGTAPTDGTSNRTLKVGGAFKGPNAAVGFPFGFIAATQTNDAGHRPRVNMLGTFNVTAAITHAIIGPVVFEGYTSLPGDGGQATIDGGVVGVGYTVLTISAAGLVLRGLVIQNNGASGAGSAFATSTHTMFIRCVAHDVRLNGFNITGSGATLVECEAYACNQSAGGNAAGFGLQSGVNGASLIRCVSHDNVAVNSYGFYSDGIASYHGCIADSNLTRGFELNTNGVHRLYNCEIYNNAGGGLRFWALAKVYCESCNFVKNTGFGINTTTGSQACFFINCGFGSGTQANTGGDAETHASIVLENSVSYPANTTPWVDPGADNFAVALTQAKGVGTGTFFPTFPTVGFPDRGAAQHEEVGQVELLVTLPLTAVLESMELVAIV